MIEDDDEYEGYALDWIVMAVCLGIGACIGAGIAWLPDFIRSLTFQ